MSKFLVIAEKPSVAQSYAKNLSAYKREDGYLEGESCIVSWCLGHLAEYAQPEEYDPKYEKWQFDDLPILPEVWKLKVSKDKKKQFEVIKTLMNRSDVEYLVNGCDLSKGVCACRMQETSETSVDQLDGRCRHSERFSDNEK